MSLTRPTTIKKPFADSGDKNIIPIPSQVGIVVGAASWETGFPPDTLRDIGDGGIAPDGLDFNGLFNIITQHIRFMNAGGYPRFDATLCSEIGGYPYGVILQDNAGDNLYRNVSANNTVDFNATPAAIGVSWKWISGVARTLTAGDGLTGGGGTDGNVTIDLGTPSTCQLGSVNSVNNSSHTHALDIPSSNASWRGLIQLAINSEALAGLSSTLAVTPSTMQYVLSQLLTTTENVKKAWRSVFETGISGEMSPDTNVTLTFPEAFSSIPVVIPYMINSSTTSDDVFARVVAVSATQCTLRADSCPNPSWSGTRYIGYLAIGIIN